MALGDFFTGTAPRYESIQRFTPNQQQALSQLLGTGLQAAQQRPQADFAPIAEQARTQFQQRTIPTIAERFTAMGGGAQQSGAFPQILGSAASDLETNLAALGSEFGLRKQALDQQQMFDLLRLGLTPQFEPRYVEGEPGFLQSVAAPAGQSILSLLGGGGLGSLVGGGLNALLSLFGSGRSEQPSQTSRTPYPINQSIRQGYGMIQ